MLLCDYHLHSEYSFDSDQKMEPVCEKAVELSISKICFTDHIEFAGIPGNDASMESDDTPWPDFDRRKKEIERLRDKYSGRLTILNGAEIGQGYRAPDPCKRLICENGFDFVIGAIHKLTGN
ncbi:MAG: PHP domain-containing protein, partial [Lachnospiraceae bacterium]|nr:PHP domain-containing protein [Lachnospiraceae bacterium]